MTVEDTPKHQKEATNSNDTASKGNFEVSQIKEAIKEEQAERAYQEKEKKRRAANVIIYGLGEMSERKDREQIEVLFKTINLNIVPKSFTPLWVKN